MNELCRLCARAPRGLAWVRSVQGCAFRLPQERLRVGRKDVTYRSFNRNLWGPLEGCSSVGERSSDYRVGTKGRVQSYDLHFPSAAPRPELRGLIGSLRRTSPRATAAEILHAQLGARPPDIPAHERRPPKVARALPAPARPPLSGASQLGLCLVDCERARTPLANSRSIRAPAGLADN